MKRHKQKQIAKAGWEVLEERRYMSAVTLTNGTLTLKGNNGSDNTFYVRAAADNGVFAMANGTGEVQPLSQINNIVVDLGNKADTVFVSEALNTKVEVISANGAVTMMNPGEVKTFAPAKVSQKATTNTVVDPVVPTAPTPVTKSASAPVTTTQTSGNTGNDAGNTTSDGVQANITVTGNSDVYPLQTVNVSAVTSNFGNETDSAIKDAIQWNFGDPTSQYNTLNGFNAAHVYSTAGTYTVTLTITSATGQVSTATQQVTVMPDNRATIYVSASGNDSNSGNSASDPIQTIDRLMQLMTSNTRVLFQAGGTYTITNTNTFTTQGMSNVYIGSYGSGAQPIIMYTGPAGIQGGMLGMSTSTTGLTVQGLTFDSIYSDNNDAQAIPSAFFVKGNGITILDNTFLNVLNAMNMNSCPDNVLVQGNSAPSATGLNAYFTFIQGSNIVVVGNNVANGVGESLIRGGGEGVLIADNTLNNNQKVAITIQLGSYEYVYGNQINNGQMGVGPLSAGGGPSTTNVNNIVFENNVSNTNIDITSGSHDIMVRNNVLTLDGDSITINAQDPSLGWQAQNIYLEYNTVIDTSNYGGFLTINNGVAQDIYVDNNLLVAPELQTGEGQGIIKVDSTNLDSFAQINDNVWAIPSPSGWAQGGYFYVDPNGGVQAGYLTPTQWEATGVPTNDVYENVTLSSTYSVTAKGFTAGSSLATPR
ncbi:MAG: PKD domain-containing protein [Tepidisphaeraceae bacterium]|jgi:hypothetical protein